MNKTYKTAKRFLNIIGDEFADAFRMSKPHAIKLRSSVPSLCWREGQSAGFAVIDALLLPDKNDCPALYRLRVNLKPPKALYVHLKSAAILHNLGLNPNPSLAENPRIEISTLYTEMASLGAWLPAWLDAQTYKHTLPPQTNMKLTGWGWDEVSYDVRTSFETTPTGWRDCTYLWSAKALDVFDGMFGSQNDE